MEMRTVPLQLMAYGLSDPGLVRKNNEDVWGCLPEQHLYVLADGMGGHRAGEVAAREAVIHFCSTLRAEFEEKAREELPITHIAALVKEAIAETNTFIYEMGQTDEQLLGMGTTLVSLCFYNGYVICSHVGDSRAYRFRSGELLQITDDHSLLRELLENGQVPNKQALADSPYKNILTRAVGTNPSVEATVSAAPVEGKDLYLLCSDGLSDLLNEQEIRTILSQTLSVEEKVRSLIAAAKHKGGYDNVTVVLIEVAEGDSKENIFRQ